MKTTFTQRIFSATVVAAFLLLSTTSFAALNAYLKLEGAKQSYTCTADNSGQFSFKDVQPGTYKLVWVLQKGEGAPTGDCSIEISSFSFGASNQSSVGGGGMGAGKSSVTTTTTTTEVTTTTVDAVQKQKTKSNNSNERIVSPTPGPGGSGAGKVSVQDIHFRCDASKLKKSTEQGGMYETIILEEVIVSSVSSPSGKVGGMSYDLVMSKKM